MSNMWPPLWSSGQSSWLYIQRSRVLFPSLTYFLSSGSGMGGPLSLMSTIDELLERNSSGCGLESREYGRRHSPRWPRGTLSPQSLALTSQTSSDRWVGIVRSRTKAWSLIVCVWYLTECKACMEHRAALWMDSVRELRQAVCLYVSDI
jgi:hypothetical protein